MNTKSTSEVRALLDGFEIKEQNEAGRGTWGLSCQEKRRETIEDRMNGEGNQPGANQPFLCFVIEGIT